MTDLSYPIGRFQRVDHLTPAERGTHMEAIAAAPAALKRAVQGLTPAQLDTPYRPEGWTVRQVTHHVPDSHLNAYIRFKWTLTEPAPTIKAYDQKGWAQLADTRDTPVEVSLTLLDALHTRWLTLLKSLAEPDWARTLTHPESGVTTLDTMLAMYAWHGRHHVAHITTLRERMKW